MFDDPANRAKMEAFLTADPATADRAGIDYIVGLIAGVRAMASAMEVAVAHRVRELATSPASESPTDVLAGCGSRSEARDAADRAEACAAMPSFETALAAGEVTTGHVDALARATRNLDEKAKSALAGWEDDLLASATSKTVEAFGKEVRAIATIVSGSSAANERLARQRLNRRLSRSIDRHTGMWKLFAELDTEAGAKLWAAIDAQLDTIKQRDGNSEVPLECLAVDALVELATTGPGEVRVPEVCVHVDWQTLLTGLHDQSLCEVANGVPLPVDTVRRLCCDAVIVPVLIGPDGLPVDCGREVRTATRKQRRLLRSMYRTCGHPSCDVPFEYCHLHHILPWMRHGRTDLDNLLPLCSRHHHLVHEGGWTLTMTPDRVITLTRTDGVTVYSGSTVDRTPATRRTTAPAPAPASGAPPGRRTTAA